MLESGFWSYIGTSPIARQIPPAECHISEWSWGVTEQVREQSSLDHLLWFLCPRTAGVAHVLEEFPMTFCNDILGTFLYCSGAFCYSWNKRRLKEITKLSKDKRQWNYIETHFIQPHEFERMTFWAKLPRFFKWMLEGGNIENWN